MAISPSPIVLALAFGMLLILQSLPVSSRFPTAISGAAPISQEALPLPHPIGLAGPSDPAVGVRSQGVPPFSLRTVSLASNNCSVPSSTPSWLAYDGAVQGFWIAAPPDCIELLQNGTISGAVTVGTDPFGVAVDNATGDVYVTNMGSDNVSVVSDTTLQVVGWIGVGSAPAGVAFDGANDRIYVANSGSNDVSVIDGATLQVVDTVTVGSIPWGVAADPATGQVFVADNGSNAVSVLAASNDTLVTSVPVGLGPYGVALDPVDGRIFVSDEGSGDVAAIDTSTDTLLSLILTTAPFEQLQGLAYDGANATVWVGAGRLFMVEINATSLAAIGYASADPSGVAYDPTTDTICVTNTFNRTVGCLFWDHVEPNVHLKFQEIGLPPVYAWNVSVGGAFGTGTASVMDFAVAGPGPNNPYSPEVLDYAITNEGPFDPSPSAGSVRVSSTDAVVNVTFATAAGTFPITFVARGIPSGATWSVQLAGTVGVTNQPEQVLTEPNGTYVYTVLGPPGYPPSPANGTVVVEGGPVNVTVNFVGPLRYPALFIETGLPSGQIWVVKVNDTSVASTTSAVSINLPNGSYLFEIPPADGLNATPPAGSFQISGSPVNLSVAFGPTPTYAVSFVEVGLPTGSPWAVDIRGHWIAGTSMTLTILEPNGTYNFSVLGPPGYGLLAIGGTFTVSGGGLFLDLPFIAEPNALWPQVDYYIQSASCGSDGTVTNSVILVANVSGGHPPYQDSWSYPGGTASGPAVLATLTWPNASADRVVLTVTDEGGATAEASTLVELWLPSCAQPAPGSLSPPGAGTLLEPLLVGLIAATGVAVAALWIGVRRSRLPRSPP